MILDDFFAAAATFDDEALARIMHPEARISELPNAINTSGSERDMVEAHAAFQRGKSLLAEQTYDVHDVLLAGNKIAARATWTGTLAATGQTLKAHIAT